MILDQFSLHGKVALITGSNSGIGQGIAVGMAQAGADIVCVHRSDISQTKAMVEATGRKFASIQCQLNADIAEEIVERTVQAMGRVDILVNNAGTILRALAMEYDMQAWDEVMELNLKTVFFLSQSAAKRMVKQGEGGKIINIASILSYQGGLRVPAYTASKAGVHGLTMALSNEWAALNINVNAIAPGYVFTKVTKDLANDEARYNALLGRIPAKRWGNPEDICGAAVFLASSAANYIHGVTLPVDGGWMGY